MIVTFFVWIFGWIVFATIGFARSYPDEEVGFDVVSLANNLSIYSTAGLIVLPAFALGSS